MTRSAALCPDLEDRVKKWRSGSIPSIRPGSRRSHTLTFRSGSRGVEPFGMFRMVLFAMSQKIFDEDKELTDAGRSDISTYGDR